MTNPDPIQQRIEIEADTSGAQETQRALDGVRDATREGEQATEESTRATQQSEQAQRRAAGAMREAGDEADKHANKQGLLGRTMNGVIGSITGMVSGFVGVGGLVAAFQAVLEAADQYIQRLEKIIKLQTDAARATLDLHAINQTFDQGEEDFVQAFANATGRDFAESAGVITQFRSANAALTRDKQNELINQSLIPLALSTDQDLGSLAKFIGRIAPTTSDPREINNLVTQSVSLAGEANPDEFLGRAGQLLVSGNAAGLDNAETLALLAYGSSKLDTSIASTQLRNVFKKLSADANVRGHLSQSGISVDGDPLDILRQIAASDLGGEQVVGLFGIENSDVVESILSEIDTVNRFVDETRGAVDGPDKANAFLRDLIEKSPRHAAAIQLAQLQQQVQEAQRGNERAQTFKVARTLIERELERAAAAGVIDQTTVATRLDYFDNNFAQLSNEDVLREVARGNVRLTDEQEKLLLALGYEPGDPRREYRIATLDPNLVTDAQRAEAAASRIEAGTYVSDLFAGGDESTRVELTDPLNQELGRGPALPGTTVNIEKQIIINKQGTDFIGARDPLEDDQDGGFD